MPCIRNLTSCIYSTCFLSDEGALYDHKYREQDGCSGLFFCVVLRPYPGGMRLCEKPLLSGQVTRYRLDPTVVDCLVFCGRKDAGCVARLTAVLFLL